MLKSAVDRVRSIGFSGDAIGMSFSSSCHSLELKGKAELHAMCRNDKGQFKPSTLDLNRYLSNLNGEFYWKEVGTGFASTAEDIRLDGAVLFALLPDNKGQLNPAYLNLNFCVSNVNGKLAFRKPGTHLASTCTCFRLENGNKFSALCLTDTGKLAFSEIDLNKHLGNHNGGFKSDGIDFSHTAKDIRLDGLILRASLKTTKDAWVEALYNLNSCIENIDGRLRFHKHDGFWDRDGVAAKFLENLPAVGYVVAGLDLLHGDEDQAKRAAAECTYITILTGATVLASMFTGPIGIALGSALATPIAIISEDRIADTIHDPEIHGQFAAETLDRFVSQTLVNFLATGAAPYLGKWVSEEAAVLLSSSSVRGVGAQIFRDVADASGRQLGDQSVRSAFQTMHDSLVRLATPAGSSIPPRGLWDYLWQFLRFS